MLEQVHVCYHEDGIPGGCLPLYMFQYVYIVVVGHFEERGSKLLFVIHYSP